MGSRANIKRRFFQYGVVAMICLIAAGCVHSPQAQSCGYLTSVGTVRLPDTQGRLDHLAVDVQSKRLFVAGLENHSIEVICLKGMKRIHTIAGISEPQGLAFVPMTRTLLVASRGDGTCRSFNADTYEEGPWLDLGRNADNVRFDAQSKTVYVGSGAEPGPGLLSAIALDALLPAGQGGKAAPPRSKADLLMERPRQADPKCEATLKAHPESFQVDPGAHRLFVNVPDEHQIAVVETGATPMAVSTTWPVAAAEKNFPMAVDAASNRLYVVCRKPACVLVHDTRSGRMLSQTPCVGDSDDVYYDARHERLYVIGGEGFVDVFDTATSAPKLTLLARMPTAPKARTGLFIADLRTLVVVSPRSDGNPAAVLVYRVDR
jgi:hypothetical protein